LLAQIQRTLDDERGCWNRKKREWTFPKTKHKQQQHNATSKTTKQTKTQNKGRRIEKYNKSQTKNGNIQIHCSDASHRIYIGYWLDKKVAIRDQKEGERDGRWTFK